VETSCKISLLNKASYSASVVRPSSSSLVPSSRVFCPARGKSWGSGYVLLHSKSHCRLSILHASIIIRFRSALRILLKTVSSRGQSIQLPLSASPHQDFASITFEPMLLPLWSPSMTPPLTLCSKTQLGLLHCRRSIQTSSRIPHVLLLPSTGLSPWKPSSPVQSPSSMAVLATSVHLVPPHVTLGSTIVRKTISAQYAIDHLLARTTWSNTAAHIMVLRIQSKMAKIRCPMKIT